MMRLLAAALLLSASATGLTWLETSHSDFNEGSFSDNLYASFRDGGTVEFTTRLDLNNDGFIDVACPDMSGPSLTVYFGDSSGFSPSRSRALPAGSGGEYAIADLNWDNRAELVLGGWHTGECIIYWGSDTGPSRQNTTVLPSNTSEAITVADLDRDGYPDLILPGEAPPSVTIYWGSAQGYSTGRASEVYIGSGLGHRTVVADINRDGYLDMTVCCVCDNTRQPIVYWGANRTYRIEWLDFVGIHGWCGHGNALADLDGNGWLDVVLTGFNVVTQSYIYFGDSTGFSTSRRTIVSPGNSVGGSSAWDLDDDGDLDLIYFRGNGMLGGGAKPPLIYWNSRSAPFFRDTDTLQAGSIALNAHGGMVADFDGDANVDVLVNCTGTSSVVLWGPDWTRTTSLPCHDSHHGPQLDLGNVYDRGFAETYTSSVLDAAFVCNWGRVSWVDSVPPSASVTMSLRTGNTPSP
ncbi:VCBS repeat-containing protein, partial [candidate division WOR-3 bacterium]|nr:VCBS repeat-containing protein [candidate division WOR-3 bacterium]